MTVYICNATCTGTCLLGLYVNPCLSPLYQLLYKYISTYCDLKFANSTIKQKPQVPSLKVGVIRKVFIRYR